MISLKQRLGASAPRWIVRRFRSFATAAEFWRDYRDYAVSTAWDLGSDRGDRRRDEQDALESRITIAYHGLEKGASFPSPRRGFGSAKKKQVAALLAMADRESIVVRNRSYAEEALTAVDEFTSSGEISDLVTPLSDWDGRSYSYAEVESFLASRHSVRNFDASRRLDPSVIQSAVALAGETPSVCNRRSYRAHYFDDRNQIDRLLDLQNGNGGFGHTVPGLFVVTERRSAFVGAAERNQRWVDGGLFAMTLVWVLHAFGLASCFLNWSQLNAQTDRLRVEAGIPRSEDVIVMIAVGFARDGHRVARSPRRSVKEIFEYH